MGAGQKSESESASVPLRGEESLWRGITQVMSKARGAQGLPVRASAKASEEGSGCLQPFGLVRRNPSMG